MTETPIIPLAKPWIGIEEAKAAYDVVATDWLISGPRVRQFESEFATLQGVPNAVAVSTGSNALLAMEYVAGIRTGDEVLVPNMTFVSTATSLLFLGARPVFADIELQAYGLDVGDLEKRITPKTKAILVVHYAGQTAEMSSIQQLAESRGLKVLEDAAEAHLSTYRGRPAGGLGEAGIFSFTPSKPMTTGEGGMVTTHSEELAEGVRKFIDFGDVSKFEWATLGFNFRMPEVTGAIGICQLKRLKQAVARRRSIAKRYRDGLQDLDSYVLPWERPTDPHCYQLFTLRMREQAWRCSRDNLLEKLIELGVQSRLYFPCLHRQKVFSGLGSFNDSDFPNSVEYARTAFSLPIFPSLTDDEVERVVEALRFLAKDLRR